MNRVVITGMGVVAPNGVGLEAFHNAIKSGISGITFHQNLADANFSCCIGGIPQVSDEQKQAYLTPLQLRGFNSSGILYGCMAGMDAWKDAGFVVDPESELDYETPEEGSRPMSASASGFVPGSGSGAMVLESLDSALKRGVTIYAEVLGGHVNSGGQRNGGTLTAPNSEAVQRCIIKAMENSGIKAENIDTINGHLTATSKDSLEIENWTRALNRKGSDFPYINSLKSMVGHCLAAAGSIESVATVLQLKEQFIFPNINCNDVHPEIMELIAENKIPKKMIKKELNIAAKASFGFGDVNACIIFKRYN